MKFIILMVSRHGRRGVPSIFFRQNLAALKSVPAVTSMAKRKRNEEPPLSISRSATRGGIMHLNRSGFRRPDLVRRQSPPAFGYQVSRVSFVKDLRARRVFTLDPNRAAEEEEKEDSEECRTLSLSAPKTDEESSPCREIIDEKLEKSETVTPSPPEGHDDAKKGLDSEDQAVPPTGSVSSNKTALRNRKWGKVFPTSNSFSYRRLLPHLMKILNDASGDSKPEIKSHGNAEGSGANESNQTGKKIHQVNDRAVQMTPPDPENLNIKSWTDHKVSKNSSEPKPASCSTKRQILAPCSQLQLFKNTRLHGYRRLLPYLMDISRNSSDAPNTKQKPTPESDMSSASGAAAEESCIEQQTQNLHSSAEELQMSPSPTMESSGTPFVASHGPESPNLHQRGTEKLEVEVQRRDCMNEVSALGKRKNCSAIQLKLEGTGKSDVDANPNQISALIIHTKTPSKGILKRNKLGCRGLCSCLNCASFRLHADKGFEFSRSQMHDAEEIALELITELTSLRLLLEKSVTKEGNSSPEQLNQAVIREACQRAVDVENRAKEGIEQLKYELNVHCRIPRLLPAKVAFAGCIPDTDGGGG